MPQARSSGSRSGGSRSGSGSGSGSKAGSRAKPASAAAKRSTAPKSGGTAARRSTAAKSSGAAPKRSTAAKSSTTSSATTSAGDPRLEAAAQRLRKLNERIIEAGKEAGESTLSSYEKALKAIATSIERGPGSSDIDWIAHLATTQAKFIREVTNAWTSAARGVLK
jgi:hypothetical protein